VEDYRKLSTQPLVFALAEFRFSSVLQIAKFVPAIQEALRKSFPTPKHRIDQGINVHGGGFEVNNQDRWAFVSPNGKSSIQVSHENLVFMTSEYPRFDGFAAGCKLGLDTIKAIVDPSLITRVGLRYGDLVLVEDGEQLTELVDSSLTYPTVFEGVGTPIQRFSENLIQTNEGILAIRTLCGFMPRMMLEDPQSLPINIKTIDTPSERMILDFDHFWESKDDAVMFDVSNILDKLSVLHGPARKAFWDLTSDYARNVKWDSE
jgi:uncharacterized protein (TIGR04255 family)